MSREVNGDNFLEKYDFFRVREIQGRYLPFNHLNEVLERWKPTLEVSKVGTSFLEVPIHSVKVGSGPIKILAWSQMHGNESTTTKAAIDLVNLLSSHSRAKEISDILSACTFQLIPMLNPDGANRYIRENVNGVDLNRDAQNLQEKESKVLRQVFDAFEPDYCFNLHDQRTIFSSGDTGTPATLSFLAPAMDEERNISENRKVAMRIIAAVNQSLQQIIPGQVGRFDDSFNINCVGDAFQSLNVPTVLFEAGHYQNDYHREKVRQFTSFALYQSLLIISSGSFKDFGVIDYNLIPENHKNLRDIILRNCRVAGMEVDVAIQFEEKIKGGELFFAPKIETMAPSLSLYGHRELDCKGGIVKSSTGEELTENELVQSILLNNEKLSIESQDYP